MLELADKDFKADIITAQGYQENMLVMKKMQSLEKLETLTQKTKQILQIKSVIFKKLTGWANRLKMAECS